VEGPSSRFWSLFEALVARETPEASGEGVEVDPLLQEQWKAVDTSSRGYLRGEQDPKAVTATLAGFVGFRHNSMARPKWQLRG